MKNILFFIVLLFTTFFIQANDSIPVFEYEINYNLGKSLQKKGYVFKTNNKIYFNTTKSVFLENLNKFVESNDSGIPEINLFSKGVTYESFILNVGKDTLYNANSAADDPVLVKEKLVKQKWKSTGIKKNVSGRDCLEFTTTFRGRYYTAYVDLSVPFYYGPWKFNNLPGLLISIEDSKKQLSWKLLSVKYNSKKEIREVVNNQEKYFNNLKEIPLKDFVVLYDASKGGTISVSSSRLPRGYKKRKSLGKYKRGGLELVYEWEK